MILRTPLPQKKRSRLESTSDQPQSIHGCITSPVSDRRLVLYNDPSSSDQLEQSDMVCTYHCRQMVKSEFMDALGSAEKEVIDCQSRLKTMSKNLDMSRSEKEKFRQRILVLEQDLAASRGRENSLQERLLKEVSDSHKKYKQQAMHSSELEIQLKKEVDLRRNADSIAFAAKENAVDAEQKLKHFSESAQREKQILLNKLSESQSEAKMSYSRLNMELERMKLKADRAAEESDLLREKMKNYMEKLNEALLQNNELENKLNDLIAAPHHASSSEDRNLVKHLQEELRNYEADVQEARKLKASHSDVELLKEKLLEEKFCRERAEVELLKLQQAELKSVQLADELMALKSVVKEIPGITSFEEIPNKVSALQKETLLNMRKIGDITENLSRLEVSLEMANIGKQQAENDSALSREKVKELLLEVARLKKMLNEETEWRNRLRKESNTISKMKSGELEGGDVDKSLIEKLESSLAEMECIITEKENNLRDQSEMITHLHEKLADEAKKCRSFEREGDRLRAEISLLESKIGYGDYSAANTKVLRMANLMGLDAESEARHTIDALRAELNKAQSKLQAVEELKGQSDAGNLIDANISDKLAQLKGQIAILEKREERYKTVFADKISVFRRACCSLFGYKIIMDEKQRPNGIPVTRFSLQSIYAQTDDEKLEFEYESGNTNILVNDYTSQQEISRQVEIFIQRMNSIPAFTANLTVESFNKRTLT